MGPILCGEIYEQKYPGATQSVAVYSFRLQFGLSSLKIERREHQQHLGRGP